MRLRKGATPIPPPQDGEEWVQISGYQYDISRGGKVWSRLTGIVLKPFPDKDGYPRVALTREGTLTQFYVHHLVLDAFVGPRPPGLVANHRDGDKSNASADNLEWVTYRENNLHAFREGLRSPRAEGLAKAKLLEEDVRAIRREHAAGVNRNVLAARYGIERSYVNAVAAGRVRAYVTESKGGER